jgi:hypothetical protein
MITIGMPTIAPSLQRGRSCMMKEDLNLISSASKGKQYTLAASLIAVVQYKENEVPVLSWFVFFAVHL